LTKKSKRKTRKKDCKCIKALFYLHAGDLKLGNPNIALAMSINDLPVYMARYDANVLILKSLIGKLTMFFIAFCGIQGLLIKIISKHLHANLWIYLCIQYPW
jgi:hypothetical protein